MGKAVGDIVAQAFLLIGLDDILAGNRADDLLWILRLTTGSKSMLLSKSVSTYSRLFSVVTVVLHGSAMSRAMIICRKCSYSVIIGRKSLSEIMPERFCCSSTVKMFRADFRYSGESSVATACPGDEDRIFFQHIADAEATQDVHFRTARNAKSLLLEVLG